MPKQVVEQAEVEESLPVIDTTSVSMQYGQDMAEPNAIRVPVELVVTVSVQVVNSSEAAAAPAEPEGPEEDYTPNHPPEVLDAEGYVAVSGQPADDEDEDQNVAEGEEHAPEPNLPDKVVVA